MTGTQNLSLFQNTGMHTKDGVTHILFCTQ